MYKNGSGQYVVVVAWDTLTGTRKTGDAANITAHISKDTAAGANSNDVNPTELVDDAAAGLGAYAFTLAQAETNCDLFGIVASSATAGVYIAPVFIYTVPTTVTLANGAHGGAAASLTLAAPLALESTLTAMKGATFSGTTDSLEAIRDRGDAAWTGTSAADLWAYAARTLTAATNITSTGGTLAVDASGYATVCDATAAFMALYFTLDSGKTRDADAVAGSVVKETATAQSYTLVTYSWEVDT